MHLTFEFRAELQKKNIEIEKLNSMLAKKDSVIKSLSISHCQFKAQFEMIKEELTLEQNEKENLNKRLSWISKVDGKTAALQNENLREQNKKLLSTLIKMLNTTEENAK